MAAKETNVKRCRMMLTPRLFVIVVLGLELVACSKKPTNASGPGTVSVTEANLRMLLPAGATVQWIVLPNPEKEGTYGVPQLRMPSGYEPHIDLAARPDILEFRKTAHRKQEEFAKRRPQDATFTEELMLDAPDALVLRKKGEGRTWCESTACKKVGDRFICIEVVLRETTGPTTIVDHSKNTVAAVTTPVSDADCNGIVEIARSLAPLR